MKRSPLVVIFTTVFIDLVGFGIVIPVLPFYAEGSRFNATPRTVGLLFASYSVMQLIFSPVLGRLSDKYGRRPVLLISIIGTGIGFLILGFAKTLWMLFAGRILDGITGGNISTAQAYIADITTKEDRAKGMGLIGAAFGLGFIFGPAIGGILTRWGIHVLFFVAFSIMTTSFSLYTMFRFGYDAQHTGYLFAYVGIIAVIIQGGLIGQLVKRFGELPLVMVGALCFAASLFAVPFVGPAMGGLIGLLLGGGIFSMGNSLSTPALTSLASKSAGPAEQGTILGVTQSVASLARAVGPSLAALLINSASEHRGA